MYGSASPKLPGQHQRVESWCDDRRKASKRAVGLKRQGSERRGEKPPSKNAYKIKVKVEDKNPFGEILEDDIWGEIRICDWPNPTAFQLALQNCEFDIQSRGRTVPPCKKPSEALLGWMGVTLVYPKKKKDETVTFSPIRRNGVFVFWTRVMSRNSTTRTRMSIVAQSTGESQGNLVGSAKRGKRVVCQRIPILKPIPNTES
jgi:hypothetical protein